MEVADTRNYDVIVVGCGAAGMSAAVAALESGARVAILERAEFEDRGGQTRWTESMMRMKSETEVSDDMESHFAENSGYYLDPALVNEAAGDFENWPSIVKVLNFTDPDLVATLAEQAGPTLAWLKQFGVRFNSQTGYFITTCTPRLAPVGGGLAIVEALASWAEKRETAEFFYRTTARRLLRNDAGDVCGLEAVAEDGHAMRFSGGAVVLASGGFQGNVEMMTQYLGTNARYVRPVARGGYFNKGEGIRMALEVGAAPAGDYSLFHAEPLDPRSGAPEPVVLVFNYGILINKLARRFVDEGPGTVDATYENITRRILEQPGGIAWVILDAGIDDVPNWRKAVRSDRDPITAPTIEELAQKLGLDPEALHNTVSEFNAGCVDGPFDPLKQDGLATNGCTLPKSNWARRIERGPFMAFPIICGICFTFGGIRVNAASEVLNSDGVAIKGLYAAGEMTGIYYGTYTGSTSVLRSVVFGRIAGKHSVQ